MSFLLKPSCSRSDVFMDVNSAIEWMIEEEIIKNKLECKKCGGTSVLESDCSYMNGYRYRCLDIENCGKSVAILADTNFKTPKIPIHNYLYILYSFVEKNYVII